MTTPIAERDRQPGWSILLTKGRRIGIELIGQVIEDPTDDHCRFRGLGKQEEIGCCILPLGQPHMFAVTQGTNSACIGSSDQISCSNSGIGCAGCIGLERNVLRHGMRITNTRTGQ